MNVVINSLSWTCLNTTGVLNGASFAMIILKLNGSFGTNTGGEGSRASIVNLGSSFGYSGVCISGSLLFPQNPFFFFFGSGGVNSGKFNKCSLRAKISPWAASLGGSIGRNTKKSFLSHIHPVELRSVDGRFDIIPDTATLALRSAGLAVKRRWKSVLCMVLCVSSIF